MPPLVTILNILTPAKSFIKSLKNRHNLKISIIHLEL